MHAKKGIQGKVREPMVPAVGQSADRLGKIRDFDKSPLGPLAEREAAPRKACRAGPGNWLRLNPAAPEKTECGRQLLRPALTFVQAIRRGH